MIYICKYCNRECKNPNSLRNHERLCHSNPNRQIIKHVSNASSEYMKRLKSGEIRNHNFQKRIVHKGEITKFIKQEEVNSYLQQGWSLGVSDKTRDKIVVFNKNRGTASTPEAELIRRQRISETMKRNPNAGGRRQGSGRGKKGWYKGIFCDSAWELAFVIYHLDHNIEIKRCTQYREYIFNNEIHKYIPDFEVNGEIIEIKGYCTEQWLSKYRQNSDIKVLYEEDMKPYIDYVVQQYGKDYVNLYENQ